MGRGIGSYTRGKGEVQRNRSIPTVVPLSIDENPPRIENFLLRADIKLQEGITQEIHVRLTLFFFEGLAYDPEQPSLPWIGRNPSKIDGESSSKRRAP